MSLQEFTETLEEAASQGTDGLVSDCVARDRDWYVVERLNTRALSNLSTSSSNTNGLYFVRPRYSF